MFEIAFDEVKLFDESVGGAFGSRCGKDAVVWAVVSITQTKSSESRERRLVFRR